MKTLIQLLRNLICKLRGHKYRTGYVIDNYHLYYCQCCKKEMLDRTFHDIAPLPDDWDPTIDEVHFYNEQL